MGVAMAEKAMISVKLREDVYRLVKTLASWHGEHVGEYLSDLVGPLAQAEFDKMHKESAPPRRPSHGKDGAR